MKEQPTRMVSLDQKLPSSDQSQLVNKDEFSKNRPLGEKKNVGEIEGCSKKNGIVEGSSSGEDTGRERLKRHRTEMAGRTWIPEIWGQEELLKDWIDCTKFDASLGSNAIMSARAALVEEGRRANSSGLRIENRC